MIRTFLLLILTIHASIIYASEIDNDSLKVKRTVYLIGSIHNMHFDSSKNYSINDLLEQIRILKPDVVCGEITPEAYEQAMEGYFPPEAAVLAEMAGEMDYRFVPVDWRLDYTTQSIANKSFPAEVEKQCSAINKNIHAKLKSFNNASFYDDLHSPDILNDLDSIYEKIIRVAPLAEIASGSWQERNRRIVENGMANAKKAQTIVFVFGIDHLPQLKRQLQTLGIEAQIPKRMFTPGNNHKMTNAVLERWKQNYSNLVLIRDKKINSTYDNYQKVINSKRIENIKEALEKSQ